MVESIIPNISAKITDGFQNGLKYRMITVKAKRNYFTLIIGVILTFLLLKFVLPVGIHDESWGDSFFIILCCLIYSILTITCILWMIYGTEEMVLSVDKIIIRDKIFRYVLIKKILLKKYIDNIQVNMNLPDNLNQSKWLIMKILSMSWGSSSFHAAYQFSVGKVIFKYKNHIYRFAGYISEDEANEIIKAINGFYDEQKSNLENSNLSDSPTIKGKSYDTIQVFITTFYSTFFAFCLVLLIKGLISK